MFITRGPRSNQFLENTLSGLLLKCTGGKNGQYGREGVVQLDDEDFEQAFEVFGQQFDSLETLVGSELIPAEDYCSVEIDDNGGKWDSKSRSWLTCRDDYVIAT